MLFTQGEVNPAFLAIQRWSGSKTAKCNCGEQKRPMPLKGGIGDGSASSSCRFSLTLAEEFLHLRVDVILYAVFLSGRNQGIGDGLCSTHGDRSHFPSQRQVNRTMISKQLCLTKSIACSLLALAASRIAVDENYPSPRYSLVPPRNLA